MKKLILLFIAAMFSTLSFAQVSSTHAYAVGNTDSVHVYWDAYSTQTEILGCYLYKKITEDDEYELLSTEMITSQDSCFSFTDTGSFSLAFPPVYSIKAVVASGDTVEANTCYGISLLEFYNISPTGLAMKTKPWSESECCFSGKIFLGELFIVDLSYNGEFHWGFLFDNWYNHNDDYGLIMQSYMSGNYTHLIFTYPFVHQIATEVGTSEIAVDKEMLAISPNPVSSLARIGFSLQEPTPVTLKVMDARGQTVRVLVNETLSAGSHYVIFQRGDLPSGMYFCQLTSGKQVRVNKMIVE